MRSGCGGDGCTWTIIFGSLGFEDWGTHGGGASGWLGKKEIDGLDGRTGRLGEAGRLGGDSGIKRFNAEDTEEMHEGTESMRLRFAL